MESRMDDDDLLEVHVGENRGVSGDKINLVEKNKDNENENGNENEEKKKQRENEEKDIQLSERENQDRRELKGKAKLISFFKSINN